jgi:hypothetical protein
MFQIKSKKAWLLLIVCTTLAQSSCGFKPRRNLDALVTTPYYRDSKDDVVSFKLSEGYIDRWVVGRDRFATLQHDVFLHASGVDLKPEAEANRKEFEFPASLINEVRLHLTHYGIDDLGAAQGAENLFRFVSKQKMAACEFKNNSPSMYGLSLKAIDIKPTSKCPIEHSDDIYFKENAQKHLETVIQCSVKEVQETGIEGRLRPVCSHYFFIKELNSIAHLDYSRAYLPQWQTLEANVKRLLTTSVQTSQPSNQTTNQPNSIKPQGAIP